MSADPIARLPAVFGDVLARRRDERSRTVETLASSTGLSATEVASMERGDYELTLKDVFRIARAIGEEPAMLFVDVVAAWRGDDTDRSLYPSRPSSFERLHRLGYYHKPGDFREQPRTYDSVSEAIHIAGRLNEQRRARGVRLLDYVCTYVCMDYLHFDWKSEADAGPKSRSHDCGI